jgi:SAM-dependent methyltransferase
VVYVDHDPSVVAHGRVLLPDDKVTVTVHGDIRDPGAVLTDPDLTRVLDLERPVGVVFGSVLSLVADADDPAAIVAAFVDAVVPGSYVVISHPSPGHGAQEAGVRAAARLYADSTAPLTLREAGEVAGWFAGLDLVAPGVVPAPAWRPGNEERGGMNVPLLVGTGRVPRASSWPWAGPRVTTRGTVIGQGIDAR